MPYTNTQVNTAVGRGINMGWAMYVDSTYTSGSPLSVAGTSVQITNDGLGVGTNTSYLPPDSVTLWDTSTNKIVSYTIGNSFDLRLGFKSKVNSANSYFDIIFDIGDPSGVVIAANTLVAPKGNGVETSYFVDIPIFSLDTFVANGCKIFADSTESGHTYTIYDITLMIKQDYHAI